MNNNGLLTTLSAVRIRPGEPNFKKGPKSFGPFFYWNLAGNHGVYILFSKGYTGRGEAAIPTQAGFESVPGSQIFSRPGLVSRVFF